MFGRRVGLCVGVQGLLVSWAGGAFWAAFWDFVWFEGVVGGHFHAGQAHLGERLGDA